MQRRAARSAEKTQRWGHCPNTPAKGLSSFGILCEKGFAKGNSPLPVVGRAYLCAALLLCLLLTACSTPTLWKVDGITTGNPSFDSTRLRYATPQSHSPLTFEMLKIGNEIEAFLTLTRSRMTQEGDSHCAKVIFTIGNESVEEMIPLHQGGMKLRLPRETTERLIQALQNGEKVNILLDSFEQTLEPEQFSRFFTQFLGGNSFFQNLFKGPIQ